MYIFNLLKEIWINFGFIIFCLFLGGIFEHKISSVLLKFCLLLGLNFNVSLFIENIICIFIFMYIELIIFNLGWLINKGVKFIFYLLFIIIINKYLLIYIGGFFLSKSLILFFFLLFLIKRDII
jgi:hypothetical protein